MADYFIPDERERELLKEMLREYRERRKGEGTKTDDRTFFNSPEVYVAKVPDGGIPARVDLTPGKAECTVYRITDDELAESSITRWVYNVSTSAITPQTSEYVVIERDKFGKWVIWSPEVEGVWLLVPCGEDRNDPDALKVYVRNDLSVYYALNKVVKLAGFGDTCFKIYTTAVDECGDPFCVTITAVYESCVKCKTSKCWQITECSPGAEVRIVRVDLTGLEGLVLEDGDGVCWTVDYEVPCSGSAEDFEWFGEHDECSECGLCYTLAACDGLDMFQVSNRGLTIGSVVTIEERPGCWVVEALEPCFADGTERVTIVETYTGDDPCSDCWRDNCYKLTECTPGTTSIYATGAQNSDGDKISLEGKAVVRLSDCKVYTVEKCTTPACLDECIEEIIVTVLESYTSCATAKVYTIRECGTEVNETTYTDLEDYGYGVSPDPASYTVFYDELSGKCYEILNDSGTCDVEGSIEVQPDGRTFAYCAECLGTNKYKLTDECHTDLCGEGGTPATSIVTNTSLSAVIGKIIGHDGRCWRVSVALIDPADPVTDPSISYTGPYEDCGECFEEAEIKGITGTQRQILPCPYWDGDDIKFPAVRQIYVNGIWVATCTDDPCTIETTEECP